MTRVLVVTELTELNTGFAIYGRNLLSLLNNSGYEVCEFGIGFTNKNIERDWDIIYNQPLSDNEKEEFNYNPNNTNGQWKFERACLEFQPNIVIDIRDPFSYSYQSISPFRNLFSWFNIATVDGIPQRRQWLELFRNSDATFVYTEWAKEVLEKEGIRVSGIAAPSASKFYTKRDKEEAKRQFGLSGYKIIGSIKRNQPRKHIPELLEGFRYYLDKTGDKKTILYLHTCFPDVGWNIPELIMKYGLSSRVVLTFICKSCNNIFPSFWRGLRSFCPKCKMGTVRTVEIADGLSEESLSKIISCFDGYIQLAGREGYGMPQLEAAMCGKPVISIDYAGMKDFIDTHDALKIQPDNFKYSYDMEMYDAMVKPETVADAIERLLQEEEREYKSTSWEENLSPILHAVKNNNKKTIWLNEPYDIKPIPEYQEFKCHNYDYAKYLVLHVLQKPEYLSSLMFTRLVEELNVGGTFGRHHGSYLLEPSHRSPGLEPFTREVAYKFMVEERARINYWEMERKKLSS